MAATRSSPEEAKRATGRADWSAWPAYDAAASGLEDYWYPVLWSSQVSGSPVARRVCGQRQRATSRLTHDRDTPYSRAASACVRPSTTTAVITNRAFDMTPA